MARRSWLLPLTLSLALAAPLPARADDQRDLLYAAIPLGMSAGYLYTGNWGRALIAPVGLYGVTFAGLAWGWTWGWEHASWKDPIGSFFNVLTGPVVGAGLGFAAGSTVILLDQAFLPQAGGPFAAPLISIGTTAALIGAAEALSRRPDRPSTGD